MKKPSLLFLAFVLLPAAVRAAGITVEDRWSIDGTAVIRGENWSCEFSGRDEGMLFGGEAAGARQRVRIVPFDAEGRHAGAPSRLDIEKTADGERITVSAVFPAGRASGGRIEGAFSFNPAGMLEMEPGPGMEGASFRGDIKYGVLPGIFLEDVIFDPRRKSGGAGVHAPSEGVFAGLLGEGEGILVCAWPGRSPSVRLLFAEDGEEEVVESIEITLSGMSLYAGLLVHGDIWHLAEFPADRRDRDLRPGWKKPFEAVWRTELMVEKYRRRIGVGDRKTRSAAIVHDRPSARWTVIIKTVRRGPVWFDENGEIVFYLHAGRIGLDEDRALIYPLEGHPLTLMGFLARTPLGEHFARMRERKHPIHPPRGAPSVGFTGCWGTALLRRTLLGTGVQWREQEFLSDWLEYAVDYAAGVQNRRRAYAELFGRIADELRAFNPGEEASPEAASFLRESRELAEASVKAYDVYIRKDGQDSPEGYVEEMKSLAERLRLIITAPGDEFTNEYNSIIGRMNSVIWAQVEEISEWGWYLREWFQEAGEACKDNPGAVECAEMIRSLIREFLRERNHEVLWGV